MARTGITFKQVSDAADTLVAEGKSPTIISVREHLGTGSPNTIHAHLKAWREARPAPKVEAIELPTELRNAIAEQMRKAASTARAEVQDQLMQAQAEAAELAQAGDKLEAERDTLIGQVAALTTERDTLAGKSAEQSVALVEAAQRIEREQQAAESARIELAKTLLQIEQQALYEARYTAEIAELKSALKAAEKDAVAAEKSAAVTGTKLDAVNTAWQEALARAQRAENAIADAAKLAAEQAKALETLRSITAQEVKKAAAEAAQQAERAARAEGRLAAFEEAAKRTQA